MRSLSAPNALLLQSQNRQKRDTNRTCSVACSVWKEAGWEMAMEPDSFLFLPQRLTNPSFFSERVGKEGREKIPPESDACRGSCGACSDREAGSSQTRSVYLEYRRIDGDHMDGLPRSSVAQLDAIKTWQPLIGR